MCTFCPTHMDIFFDMNNNPASRYFNDDGIHLSRSGVKRLVDAMSTSVKIVVDYELRVFSNFRKPHQNMNMNTNMPMQDIDEGTRDHNRSHFSRIGRGTEIAVHHDPGTLKNNAMGAIWLDIF